MPQISRVGDRNSVGGQLLRRAETVFANGIPIALHPSEVSSHSPWGREHSSHESPVTTRGSPTVFVEGCPPVYNGSPTTCGHPIVEGSPDVFVP